MNGYNRLVFLLVLYGFAGGGVYLNRINEGFWDGFPLWLYVFVGFSLCAALFLLRCIKPYIPRSVKDSLRYSIIMRWLDGKIVFTGCVVFGIILHGLVIGGAAWFNRLSVSETEPRLFVFGLDGATWNLIGPMMEEGEMPVIRELCQTGARGTLLSFEPMQSPDLWTSMATGVPPEKHGITGFFCTRNDLRAHRVWDIGHREGLTVGLFSWLVTWPPRDPFAFIVPSWMARSPETRPPDCACIQELYLDQSRYGGSNHPFSELGQCIHLGARMQGVQRMAEFAWRDRWGLTEETRLAAKLMAEMRLRTDLFIGLLKRHQPDIATFSLYGSDKLAHRFWHYMEPEKFPDLIVENNPSYRDVIPNYYRRADEELGRILQVLPPSCTVVVVSDHGFKADLEAPRQFFLDVPNLLKKMGLSRLVFYYTIQRQAILELLAPEADLLESIQTDLEEIRFSESGEAVFQVEVEEGKRITLRPNFSLSWNEDSPVLTQSNILLQGKALPTKELFSPRIFSGTHDPKGIVLLKGPGIRSGVLLQEAQLLDVAPTLLYLLDLPISRGLPGRILQEAVDETYWNSHLPVYVDTYGEFPILEEDSTAMPESLMEQLRSLDYVK